MKKIKLHHNFFKVFMIALLISSMSVSGCGSNDDPGPVTPEVCRKYPRSMEGYRYEWDPNQNAIIGHNISYECLARTRAYANKKNFIAEGEVFGLDFAQKYDDVDCMEGGPSFFTTNTFEGPKLIATSYRIDDIDVELYEYTWEIHDPDNRPISGFRKVLFAEGGEVLDVMCTQQLIIRTYYDEKRMVLEERFSAEIVYPLQDQQDRANDFQKSQCKSSLAKQYYFTEYGQIYAIKWFSLADIDPDIDVPPPPEPDGVFEVCVE